MALHSAFFHYALSSDVVADGNGQSSNTYHITSDAGNILMALDSDHTYHITQLHIGIESVSDNALVALCALDSNSSDAGRTLLSQEYKITSGAANTTGDALVVDFNPPIKVAYSSVASGNAYLSLQVTPNDSDAAISASYNGFTLTA